MQTKRMRLIFQDEAPRIGCGERGVKVKVGRKYVYVTERATGARARLPLPVFTLLAAASLRRNANRRGGRA